MVEFKASDYFKVANHFTEGPTSAMRTTYSEYIDDNDFSGWRGVIDCRHLHALQVGKQAMSQFGHGKYTVKLHIWPQGEGLLGDLLQDDSETTIGMAKIDYVMPTKARYAALHHLKTLEKNNNLVNQTENVIDGEAHPLLAADLDTDDPFSPGSATGAMNSGNKGAKVIRFAFDSNTYVYGQDSFISDINNDGDVHDDHEWKNYTLMTDGDDWFGILPRYEAAINPTIDDDGNTVVNVEWDKPLNRYKAFGSTQQIQPFTYQLDRWIATDPTDNAVADIGASAVQIMSATFTGIEALGGLIRVSIPSLLQASEVLEAANNDFRIWATVTCHSWTPMKR